MTTNIRKCQAVGGAVACRAADCPEKVDRAEAMALATTIIYHPSTTFDDKVAAREDLAKFQKEAEDLEKASAAYDAEAKAKALASKAGPKSTIGMNGSLVMPATHTYTEPEPPTSGGNDWWPETTGSRYVSEEDNNTRKVKIAAEIKKAQKLGYLPAGVTFKVTKPRYNDITVTITGSNDSEIYETEENGYSRFPGKKETANARLVQERVATIMDSYKHTQRDELEGRTNHTTFWSHINIEDERSRKWREEQAVERRNAIADRERRRAENGGKLIRKNEAFSRGFDRYIAQHKEDFPNLSFNNKS